MSYCVMCEDNKTCQCDSTDPCYQVIHKNLLSLEEKTCGQTGPFDFHIAKALRNAWHHGAQHAAEEIGKAAKEWE